MNSEADCFSLSSEHFWSFACCHAWPVYWILLGVRGNELAATWNSCYGYVWLRRFAAVARRSAINKAASTAAVESLVVSLRGRFWPGGRVSAWRWQWSIVTGSSRRPRDDLVSLMFPQRKSRSRWWQIYCTVSSIHHSAAAAIASWYDITRYRIDSFTITILWSAVTLCLLILYRMGRNNGRQCSYLAAQILLFN